MPLQNVNNSQFVNKASISFASRQRNLEKPSIIQDKKKVLLAAAAIGASAIAIGGLIHKGILFPSVKLNHDAKKALKASEAIQKKAEEAKDNAMKAYNEVMTLIKEGSEKNFEDVLGESGKAKISFKLSEVGENVPKTMTEFDEAGNIVRETHIYLNKPESIQEYIKGSKKHNIYTFNTTSKEPELSKAVFNCKINLDDDVKKAEEFIFSNSKLTSYKKEVKLSADLESAFERYCFEEADGKTSLSSFDKKYRTDVESGSFTAFETIEFENGKPTNASMHTNESKEKLFKTNENGKLKQLKD